MESLEEKLDQRLTRISVRIQEIADIEARAAQFKSYGARGEMMGEKMKLISEADKIIEQLQALYRP